MKKAYALLLLLTLLGTLWPAAARAESAGSAGNTGCTPAPAEADAVSAVVQRLAQFRIVLGDPSGSLGDPEVRITRAEVAATLLRALGRETEAAAHKGELAFTDTASHWASGFVAVLKAEGVVQGRSDGSFAPDNFATLGETEIALARLLRLGVELTPGEAEAALHTSGVTVPPGCAAGEMVSRLRFYLLLDQALQVPFYRRLGIAAAPPGPACATHDACVQQLSEALQRIGQTPVVHAFEASLNYLTEPFPRAMAARLLTIVLGSQAEAGRRQGEVAFPDMDGNWAAGDVALLKTEGMVRGRGDGRFYPNDKLTIGEGEILVARLLRLGSDLTPAQAEAALEASGIHWAWGPGGPSDWEGYGHFLPLLDQALRTPLYARFPPAH